MEGSEAARVDRPVCSKDTQDEFLPETLRNSNRDSLRIARRIDGEVNRSDAGRL